MGYFETSTKKHFDLESGLYIAKTKSKYYVTELVDVLPLAGKTHFTPEQALQVCGDADAKAYQVNERIESVVNDQIIEFFEGRSLARVAGKGTFTCWREYKQTKENDAFMSLWGAKVVPVINEYDEHLGFIWEMPKPSLKPYQVECAYADWDSKAVVADIEVKHDVKQEPVQEPVQEVNPDVTQEPTFGISYHAVMKGFYRTTGTGFKMFVTEEERDKCFEDLEAKMFTYLISNNKTDKLFFDIFGFNLADVIN